MKFFEESRFKHSRTPVHTKLSTPLQQATGPLPSQIWMGSPSKGTCITNSEADLVKGRTTRSCFLTEPGFDTSDTAVFPSAISDEEQLALKPIVWRRVTGPLIIPSQNYVKLVQGCLCRNNWFTGALAAVATKQHLLLNLIVSDEHAASGLYTFQIFKHEWTQVVVDNRLPCVELQQRLAYVSSSTPQELWPSLLEKAYARLHGGYAAIATGSVADALTDLTGGLVESISLAEGAISEAATWLRIVSMLREGSLVVSVAEQLPARDSQQPAALTPHDDQLAGVLTGSPYSVLAAKVLPNGLRLMRLHNPWSPEGSWPGVWGSGAAVWSTKEGQAVLEADPVMAQGLQDPATFWCPFRILSLKVTADDMLQEACCDFIQVFSTLHVVHLPHKGLHQRAAAGLWSGALGATECVPTAQPCALFPLHSNIQPEAADGGSKHQQTVLQPGMQHPGHQPTVQQWGVPHQQQRQQEEEKDLQRRAGGRSRQQCQQVSSGSMAWAQRQQYCLVTASTCEVLMSLSQQDVRMNMKDVGEPSQRQQQQLEQQEQLTEALEIGLYVLRTQHDNHTGHTKAMPTAGMFHRPGTNTCNSQRGINSAKNSSIQSSRGPTKAPSRPSTAPAAHHTAAADSLHRLWAPELQRAVLDSGLSRSRDVVIRFVAEAGRRYILVPYTRTPSDQAPFLLRVWAPCPLLLEEEPSPYLLCHSGRWEGSSAGGSMAHASWGCNPQYSITCTRQATALICLQRPDVCNSVVQLPFDPSDCISLAVCRQQGAAGLRPGSPKTSVPQASSDCTSAGSGAMVVGSTQPTSMSSAVMLLRLQPGTSYVLTPSTAQPGVEAPFDLFLLSSAPLEMAELPKQCTIRLSGSWGDDTSGGSSLHSTWVQNPAFKLQLERKTRCRIALTRAGGGWRRNEPLKGMIGLSVWRLLPAACDTAASTRRGQPARTQPPHAVRSSHTSRSPPQSTQPTNSLAMLKQRMLCEAAAVPMQTCEVEWLLPGGETLVLVPHTYGPGVKGDFSLSVTTRCSTCLFDAVPGGLLELLTTTNSDVTCVTRQ